MANGRYYFLLNKESDYRRGFVRNLTVRGGGLRPPGKVGETGCFYSKLYDSRTEQMEWHRLTLNREGVNGAYTLCIYTSDEREFLYREKITDIEDFIRDESVGAEEKEAELSRFLRRKISDAEDILLHDIKGRYLWIKVVMYGQQNRALISDIRIEFPRQTIMKYLPEIYRTADEDGFLERYLGIFQTIYEDRGRMIAEQAKHFDMDSAEEKDLFALAEWIGIENPHVWNREDLRLLIRHGIDIFRRRGTKSGLCDLIEIYCGKRPFVIEPHEMEEFRKNAAYYEQISKLYELDKGKVLVLLPESIAGTRLRVNVIHTLIRDMMPAHVSYELVLLRPYIYAGMFSYLGINTYLGKYREARLDGASAVSFTRL